MYSLNTGTVVVLGTHHCMARVNELVDVFIKYRDRRGARNIQIRQNDFQFHRFSFILICILIRYQRLE